MKSNRICFTLFLAAFSGLFSPLNAQETLWKEQTAWEGVPEYYQKWNYPDFQFPSALPVWKNDRVQVAATLQRLLGDIPSRPKSLKVKTVFRKHVFFFFLFIFLFFMLCT